MMRAWAQIPGVDTRRCLELSQRIATELDAVDVPSDIAPSLFLGYPGRALLFAYLDRAFGGTVHRRRTDDYVDLMLAAAARARLDAGLAMGASGIGWVLEHLRRPPLFLLQGDPNADTDELLIANLESQCPCDGQWKLLDGIAGVGVYALERIPSRSAYRMLQLVVENLEQRARHLETGIAWYASPAELSRYRRAIHPRGYYNLGMLQGCAGVVALLARILRAGVLVDRVRTLLSGSVRWMLSQPRPEDGRSRFPAFVDSRLPVQASRTAWCEGDLGIATALVFAARALADHPLHVRAQAMMRAAAVRRFEPMDPGRARYEHGAAVTGQDAGICHGAAGMALVLARAYQRTFDAVLSGACARWIDHLLAMHRPGAPNGGYPVSSLAYPDRQLSGLGSGALGIALVLLAVASAVEPGWDRLLLLSAAPPCE